MNRWVVSEVAATAAATAEAFSSYRFNEAALGLYRLVWDRFCDWYVELAKPLLTSADPTVRDETRAAAAWAMARILHLLHPMAPFVTEELWASLFGAPGGLLIRARWPEARPDLLDPEAEAELSWLTRLVGAVRSARTELDIPAGARLRLRQHGADAKAVERLARYAEPMRRMAGLDGVEPDDSPVAPRSLQVVVDEAVFHAHLGEVVDLAKVRARLEKEAARARGDLARTDERLANPDVLARAPAEVVDGLRERRGELSATLERLGQALARIA